MQGREVAPGRIHLSTPDARALAEAALQGAGWTAGEAVLLADHMLDAALCGYEYSGLPKILNLAQYRRSHPQQGPMRVVHETDVSARIDAGGANGMLALECAARIAIEKATARGMAVVAVGNTWMSGRGAYYAEIVARAGLVCLHTVSSRHQVAPPGATKAAIGTNPISFGFPTEGEPLLIDLGTSSMMFTDLALRVRRGEPLAPGLAIDAQGQPTTDPALAQLGAVLPFGGYKGFALALGMLGLGVLAGPTGGEGTGYVLIALQPGILLPPEDYRRELSAALARIKATPRQPGVDEIRIPSERAFATRRRLVQEGIVIDRDEYEALRELAGA